MYIAAAGRKRGHEFKLVLGQTLADFEPAIENGYFDPRFKTSDINRSFFLDNTLNSPLKRELQNLRKFFQTTVHWPWTFPVIKKVIKLPPNPLFTLLLGWMCFVNCVRSEWKDFRETFKMATMNWRYVLSKQ